MNVSPRTLIKYINRQIKLELIQLMGTNLSELDTIKIDKTNAILDL